jgi:hypothetical protein
VYSWAAQGIVKSSPDGIPRKKERNTGKKDFLPVFLYTGMTVHAVCRSHGYQGVVSKNQPGGGGGGGGGVGGTSHSSFVPPCVPVTAAVDDNGIPFCLSYRYSLSYRYIFLTGDI